MGIEKNKPHNSVFSNPIDVIDKPAIAGPKTLEPFHEVEFNPIALGKRFLLTILITYVFIKITAKKELHQKLFKLIIIYSAVII